MSSATLPEAPVRDAHLDRVLVTAFLDHVPDLVYFKDRRSRFIAVSRSLVRYFGGATAAQIVGRTDFDFFSARHARPTYEAEQRIMLTGQPELGKVERETWLDGRITWIVSHRLPLRDRGGRVIGTFGLARDITVEKTMETALAEAHRTLVDASRLAGMAEVATGVLHNVGNVLNSLNVSASVVADGLRASRCDSLVRLAALLAEHRADLADYLTRDAKGRRIPELLSSLAAHAIAERTRLLAELASLQQGVDHIKEIVSMQQAYATMRGIVEPLDPGLLFEDALRMTADSFGRHRIELRRDLPFVPSVLGEKAKVLQILINLLRNAQQACDGLSEGGKQIGVRLAAVRDGAGVQFSVTDNGVGIPAANLTRIFAHGFTTRPDGHGFGLHSAANAAREMNGTLVAASDGPGRGATFTLELPAAPPAVPAA